LSSDSNRPMAKDFIVYHLTGLTLDREIVDYTGYVKVLPWQTNQEAANWRLERHLKEPKFCLKNLAAKTAEVTVLTSRITHEEALVMEAVRTVVFFSVNPKARGGPYCLSKLPAQDSAELQALTVICQQSSWSDKARELKTLASRLPGKSSLRRHLEDRCYKCGLASWKSCACRVSTVVPSQTVPMPVAAVMKKSAPSSSSSSSLASATAMKSRSGKRKTIRTRRVGRDPAKKRSGSRCGKKKSGCQRRKEQNLKKGSKQFQRAKWGHEAKQNVQNANKAAYAKRVVAKRIFFTCRSTTGTPRRRTLAECANFGRTRPTETCFSALLVGHVVVT
jgi:hypothetical protein